MIISRPRPNNDKFLSCPQHIKIKNQLVSDRALAAYLNLHPASICEWKAHRKFPSQKTAKQICRIINKDFTDFRKICNMNTEEWEAHFERRRYTKSLLIKIARRYRQKWNKRITTLTLQKW